jgi:hypothetical protein
VLAVLLLVGNVHNDLKADTSSAIKEVVEQFAVNAVGCLSGHNLDRGDLLE